MGESYIDWEDAFANADYIADGASYPARWAKQASAFRTTPSAQLDIAYGEQPREKFDLFLPASTPRGLVVFVHGGYWLKFDKSTWSHLASGPVSLGWAVAMPSYTLAPEASLPEMTQQIGRAIEEASRLVDGPIRLAGHSAGGHLVTRMVCQDGPLTPSTANRIERVISISGLHDLRPLQHHSMNSMLALTPGTTASESSALNEPLSHVAVTAWVGAMERPEFLRQSALLAEAWTRKGVKTPLVADPNKHHFDVIDGLTDANHPLSQALAGR
ncbi:MAG: alpha/beta hydrolase [Gammaproteobacteria bacterium]|nr:alpha/beta hydrolase [Gammaproteobacteria bacterium]